MIPGLQGIGKIPELRKRIFFVLGMLAVYRLGVFVSTPGINVEALRNLFDTGDGTLFGLVNMFSGGALEQFSIFTLGIMPYISVSIVIQLLTSSIPRLEALKKEGESGQRIITRYTRQGTVVLALFQGFMISLGLEQQGLVLHPGLMFRVTTMITLTAGTAFIMWLGEQITEKGIGNGMSIIIFAGIIARMPQAFVNAIVLARTGEVAPISVLLIIAFSVLTVAGIVFVERSHRK
ncbi:MAG: preprotein translocase subunit SecY, partial [Bdellovibrionales bacterium]|nr:preprotein translocase subunit SecY [Bdellovibrionales bacterium]